MEEQDSLLRLLDVLMVPYGHHRFNLFLSDKPNNKKPRKSILSGLLGLIDVTC